MSELSNAILSSPFILFVEMKHMMRQAGLLWSHG